MRYRSARSGDRRNPGPLTAFVAAVLACAAAEQRTQRRLARTWLLGAVAIGGPLAHYVSAGFIHAASVTPGAVERPRFALSALGFVILSFVLAGVVLLVFDRRTNDHRDRIVATLNARPVSNLALLVGRLLAVTLAMWVPLLLLAAALQTYGVAGAAVGLPTEPVEPYGLLAFLLVDALPTITLWTACVLFVDAILRNRWATLTTALLVLATWLWGSSNLASEALLQVAMPWAGRESSDLVVHLIDAQALGHRAGMLCLATALTMAAAALEARLDSTASSKGLAAAAGFAILGSAGIVSAALDAAARDDMRAQWHAASGLVEPAETGDLKHVGGVIRIDPGRRLELDLALRMDLPPGGTTTLSFNPGLVVADLRIAGESSGFRHEDGLLRITSPADGAEDAQLSLVASGRPSPFFAHLDDLDAPPGRGLAYVARFGTDAAIFERDYVALLPQVRWLPKPGANTGVASRPGDFFTVDLAVVVPSGWEVAGPGFASAGEAVRLASPMPLPDLALITAPFERHSARIADVDVHLLHSPKHFSDRDALAVAVPKMRAVAADFFTVADRMGLGYPYGSLTLVEVPSRLRTFGGGLRLDSGKSLPGLLLIDENGLPSARFGWRSTDARGERLRRYVLSDVVGGNPLIEVPDNVLGFLTAGAGPGARVLDFTVSEMARLVLVRTEVLPPASPFAAEPLAGRMSPFAIDDRPAIWARATTTSLVALESGEVANATLGALRLRASAIARSIVAGLGRDRAGALLAELRRQHIGEHFDEGDFRSAAAAVGGDIRGLVGDWLNDAAIPAFAVSTATVTPVECDGGSRHHVRLHVHNAGRAPGVARIRHAPATEHGAPFVVGAEQAVEVAFTAAARPTQLGLEPYFAHNRRSVAIAKHEGVRDDSCDAFTGVRPSDWRPQPVGVVVDDLDDGFDVQQHPSPQKQASPPEPSVAENDMDHGLPRHGAFNAAGWTRQEIAASWGKYRHTAVRSAPGDDDVRVVFSATLPTAGAWLLDYHMPPLAVEQADTQGPYELWLEIANDRHDLAFDGSAAVHGWNRLGRFELPAAPVRLVVSNRTTGQVVFADAVRWVEDGDGRTRKHVTR